MYGSRYNPATGQFELEPTGSEYTFAPAPVEAPAQPEQVPGQQSGVKSGGVAAAQTAAQGGSVTDVVGSGLVASGNPYAMAAGLGLMTAGSIKKGQNEREMQRYEAEVAKINARQEAINRLAQIGAGLKA